MKKHTMVIVAVAFALLMATTVVCYSWCLGPPYNCSNCPYCGSLGTVIEQREVGSGFNKTCIYTMKCWNGHVWVCAQ